MPTDVIMPQMGESIFEGTITKWLKQPGDRVEKDEPLFEISTDKVDAEIPSPAAGLLTEIKALEGATVQINTVVAVIGEQSASRANRPKPQPAAAPHAQPAPPQVTERGERSAPSQFATPSHLATPPQPTPPQPTPPQLTGATDVVMPQMGESIFEGTITRWLKQLGDTVEKDEPLFEISTDKVDAEIPAPAAGILTEIKAQEGATVQINTVVAVIGGSLSSPVSQPRAQSAPPQVPAPNGTTSETTSGTTSETTTEILGPAQSAPQSQPAAPTRALRSSPLVRRIAKEHNVDLARITGTGSEGRITKEDILGYLSQATHLTRSSAPPQVAPPRTRSSSGQYAGQRPDPSQNQPQNQHPDQAQDQVVPLSRMRAIIGQRMVESVRISPHAHTVYKVDMSRIARLRERERAGFEQRTGVKLTYMPFIAAAAVQALRKFPIVNASLVDGSIHYHAGIHLGIAVALEGGLIVPVIREAQQRSFADLARAINDLALRARSRKLNPDEAAGSTFTLTNSGVFGGEYGTPIINQPESAILAIGGLRKEPVVLTDAEGNDTIAIRSMQYYCLGFDHRTIDGADAGKFMSEFKGVLENWNGEIG